MNIDVLETKQKWVLLPVCVALGLALLIAFVSFSQNYLSDYLIRNSKEHIGEKIDPQILSQLLKDPEIFTNPQPRLLVFWSVTCAPCLEKLSQIQDVNNSDYLITPINTDPDESQELAQKLLAAARPGQTFYRDPGKTLVTQLELDYLPTNVYLAADGSIEKIEVGKK